MVNSSQNNGIAREEAEAAIGVIDYILKGLGFDFLIEKDEEETGGISPEDVLKLESNLSVMLREAAAAVNKPLEKKLLDLLIEKEWLDLEDDERELIYNLAADHLQAAGSELAGKAGPIIHDQAEQVFTNIRNYLANKLEISPDLEYIDKKLINTFARDNNYWIGKHYTEAHLESLKKIGQNALEQGLGRKELSHYLKEALGDQFKDYRYWDVVASSVINRSQSYSKITSYYTAGIEEYIWVAVGDERECILCSNLNGRIFNVQVAYETLEKVAELENPEELKFVTPWIGQDKDGMYFKDRDGNNQYIDGKSTKELQEAGLGIYPAHGSCRCDYVINTREEKKVLETEDIIKEHPVFNKKVVEKLDIEPGDMKKYSQVMNLNTAEMKGALARAGLTRDEAILKINDARLFTVINQSSKDLVTVNEKYPAERIRLHRKISKDLVNSKPEATGQARPKLLITGGYPGAGKSTMLKTEFYKGWQKQYVHIDSDDIKERLAKRDGVSLTWRAALYHDEADVVVKRTIERAKMMRGNILYDCTMKNTKKTIALIKHFKESGYDVEVAFADLPMEKTMVRAIERFLENDRFVDPIYIASHGNKNRATVDAIESLVDECRRWSTDVPYGEKAKLISSKSPDR